MKFYNPLEPSGGHVQGKGILIAGMTTDKSSSRFNFRNENYTAYLATSLKLAKFSVTERTAGPADPAAAGPII